MGTNVLLQVVSLDGSPIGTATLTVDGVARFTDAAGFILFDDLPDGRFTARVDAGGYGSNVVALDVGGGSSTYKQVRLLPLGPAIPFDADLGGELEIDGVRVEIPPYVLVDRNGAPVTGMVEATITSMDPTDDALTGSIGTLEGIDENGDDVGLLSVAMAEISLWQAGQPLQLAPGALAHIELDVPIGLDVAHQPGDEIPAWWLDLDAGVWREEGMGTIEVDEDDPTQLVWAANVEHFTLWNADWNFYYGAPLTECFVITLVDQFGNLIPDQYFTTSATISDPLLVAQGFGSGVFWDEGTSLDTNVNLQTNCVASPIGTQSSISIPSFGLEELLPLGPGIGGRCWDDPCTPVEVVVEVVPPVICTPGSSLPCGYTGPPATEDVGICQGSSDYCIDGGTAWSGCQGEVLPEPETCTTIFDDDCNGVVNDAGALDCDCGLGDMLGCYSGSLGTEGVGPCMAGVMSCNPMLGQYGPCLGQVTPVAEDCASLLDENCNGIPSCEGAALWATGFGSGLSAQGSDIAVSSFGDVYTVGSFDASIDFGTGALVSAGSTDIFLVKQSASGATLWSKRIGGTGLDSGLSVDLDGSGNPLVTGVISDTVNVDGVSNLVSAGSGDIVVVKLNANGVHQWSTRFGGPSYDGGFGITSNGAGDVFVTGTASGDVFPGVPGIGASDVFILALDGNSGAIAWAQVHGGGTAAGFGVDVVGGELWATGYFSQSIDFGAGVHNAAGNTDVFVAKLDALDGSPLWSGSYGGAGADAGNAIAVDPSTGNAYVTGRYTGAVDFGGGPLGSAGNRDIFVVGLDTNGGHLWSHGWGGPLADDGLGIAFGAGGVVMTGRFIGSVDFGGGVIDSVGNFHDIVMVKLDSAGGYEWAQRFGGASDDTGLAVAADPINVYLTGYFTNDVDFGTGAPLVNASGTNVVMAKYVP